MKLARKGNVLVIALLGVLATVGVGYAAIPGSDGQVKGCYATNSSILLGIPYSKGDTRIVDSGEACRPYEKQISWSQQGPQGERGVQGVQGVQGPQGIQGIPCLSSDPACVGPKGDKGDPCLSSDPACVGPKGDKGDPGTPAREPGVVMFFANVSSNGTLEDTYGSDGATRTGVGTYKVGFTAAVWECAATATAGAQSGGTISRTAIPTVNMNSGVGDLGDVDVSFTLPSGARVDTEFHLVLACPTNGRK